nr:T9SS type A sorting domain-containing protein [Bacteroidota bacterium]
MTKIFTSILVLFCLLAQGQTKKVLFLGNSYTNVNMLPQITADVAASLGDTLLYDYNTPGGYTLQLHSTNETSLHKIREGNWDFVVLQEQSQRPAMPINQVLENVFPYAHYLDSVITAHNPCGETMFYMTWGRKNGDATYCPVWPPVCTYIGMDSLLRLRYMMMADSNDAMASPVGAVWRYIRQHFPSIELYMSDESHPSEAGSYAAACCFATAIFRENPLDINYDFTLNSTDALNIRRATKAIVYDSLLKWNIGKYDLVSEFSFVQISGLTWQFTNLSQNATGQIWDFGLYTDTTANPVYTFPAPGLYTVSLSSFNQCDTLITSNDISVILTVIPEIDPLQKIVVYPNPCQGHVFLELDSISGILVEVYNIYGGKAMTINSLTGNSINISSLERGCYYLRITRGCAGVTKKLFIY